MISRVESYLIIPGLIVPGSGMVPGIQVELDILAASRILGLLILNFRMILFPFVALNTPFSCLELSGSSLFP